VDQAGVGKNARCVEHDRGRPALIRDDAGVETGAGGGVLVAVDVDESDGLADVDGQLARDEVARVVADDADFERSCRHLGDDAAFFRGLLRGFGGFFGGFLGGFCRFFGCFFGGLGGFFRGLLLPVFRVAASAVVLGERQGSIGVEAGLQQKGAAGH
jgi:hypothetical protein